MPEFRSAVLARKRSMTEPRPQGAAPAYMRCEWFRTEDNEQCRLAEEHGGAHEYLKAVAASVPDT